MKLEPLWKPALLAQLAGLTLLLLPGCKDKTETPKVNAKPEVSTGKSPEGGTPRPASLNNNKAAANKAYQRFVGACERKDADTLWAMLGPTIRRGVESTARGFRSLDKKTLATIGYHGEPEDLSAKAYFSATVRQGKRFESICWDVKNWEIVARKFSPGRLELAIKRSDGLVHGANLTLVRERWQLEQITKAKKVPGVGNRTGKKPKLPVTKKALKPPRSFGVRACDDYAKRACTCSDRLVAEQECQKAAQLFTQWKKIARKRTMRSFVASGCKAKGDSIRRLCP